MTPDQIREQMAFLADCLRDINDRASARGADLTDVEARTAATSLTDDEQAQWDAGVAERNRLNALLERHNEVARMSQIPDAVQPGTFVAPNVNVRGSENPFDLSELRWDASASDVRSKALGAIEKVDGLSDRDRECAERTLRSVDTPDGRIAKHMLATGSPEYRKAFIKIANGDIGLLTNEERSAVEATRALALGGSGAYAVPFTFDPTIIDTSTHSVNPFRQISRVVQTTTNSWNGVSSAGVTASWDAEGAEVSDDTPTLVQVPIPVYKGQAFVPFSVEIGGDWAAIESDVRAMIMEGKDRLEGNAFAVGTGSAQPTGITKALDGTSSEIAPATAETFAIADVYALDGALEARYRQNASFLANKTIYSKIRQFDTGGGAGMWERIGAAQPPQLLGYPAYECSDMDGVLPDAAATADNFLAILGDFQNYVIVDRVGMTIELVPHLFHTSNNRPSGQRGFLAWWRVGADSVNDKAFAMLSIPTAA